ncbi:MAG: leucine-rich repeat protein, partial [Chitinispirillales bacterium]|nr:leucine-rich repeat protein [Chitinispirillales bacterium]
IRVGGYKTGKKLKSKTGWDDRECREYDHGYSREIDCPDSLRSGNGTDEFGFSALPGGEGEENHYRYVGKMAQWWTNVFGEWYQLDNRDELEDNRCIGCRGSEGASVRCVQDIPGVPEKVVGFDDPPPSIVKSWESGATTVTFYANGLLKVSGNGEMDGCNPPWVEYSRFPSVADCNSPWRVYYPVTAVIIEDGVTHIGSHAFDGCHIMSSVTIPNSVASIGGSAFHYCTSLRSIIIRNPNPPEIGGRSRMRIQSSRPVSASDIFEKDYEKIMEKACLYVPANSIDAYRAADGWKDFSCIKELESAPKGN